MSKQSDGSSSRSSCPTTFVMANDVTKNIVIVDDCHVDCIMRLFLPLSITYHDFTDWNWIVT